ncbi:MAG: HAMP domain-containing sensor histidine kinase [Gemmatimonadota bacterium]
MSVSAKLWVAFLATVLLGAVLVFQLGVIDDLAEGSMRLATISSRVSVIGAEQLNGLDRLDEHLAKYRVTGDERYAEQFVLAADRFRSNFADIDTLALTAAERVPVDRIGVLLEEFEPALESLGEAVASDRAGTPDSILLERGARWIESLRSETLTLTEASRMAMVSEAERSIRSAESAEKTAWFLAIAVLALSGLVTFTVARSVTGSLRRLADGTHRVAEGEFGIRLSGARGPEFRELEDDFNVMVERLSELERVKKDFVAGISHDLKSPLASIRMTLSVLQDELSGPLVERQRRLVELAGRSSERLAGMISHLLDLAQLEGSALPFHFRRVELGQLVHGVVAEMETRFEEKDVTPIVELPRPLRVDCDAGRIAQVVQNLVENALEVAPAGSRIEIACERRSDPALEQESTVADSTDREAETIRLTVSDRGPGVPPELASAIFDRFVRGDRGSVGGAGLGLTICREIIEAHGGKLWVETRPGGGSRFAFQIPAVRRMEPGDETMLFGAKMKIEGDA